jgi:pseudaminic acid cytidylyltransferase
MRWGALLPLRGGSKSIPGKNLRPIAGRPLYAWSLEAALESGCFDSICGDQMEEYERRCSF